jgi:hypothetical protein
VAFAVIGVGVANSTDFSGGVVDRFRALQILGIVLVAGVGLALGWRPHLGGGRALEPSGPHKSTGSLQLDHPEPAVVV